MTAQKRRALFFPVYIPVGSIAPVSDYDPVWKLDRHPFAIELQGYLEAELAKVPGIELIPSAKMVPLVKPGNRLLTYIRGEDRDAFYLGNLDDELNADCMIPANGFWGENRAGKINASLYFYLQCGSDYTQRIELESSRRAVADAEWSLNQASAHPCWMTSWWAPTRIW